MTSMLQKAIDQGSLEAVVAALEAGADIEECDIHGYQGLPLRRACFHGRNAIVMELLRRGADIHAINHDGIGAPIRMAVRGKQPETVRILLEHGAEIPAGINLGLSPEEVVRAQLVASLKQRPAGEDKPATGKPLPDQEIREILVSQEELDALFRKPTPVFRKAA